jgi:hypothetical protein
MKRDMDLIREILLEVEKKPNSERWVAQPLLEYSKEDVVAHIMLAIDAQLLAGAVISSFSATVFRIKNEGYDFLEAAKDDMLWENAKTRLRTAGIPVSINAMKAMINTLVIEMITAKIQPASTY